MFRTGSLVFLALVTCLALLATPAAAREFPQTGYSVTNDKFLDYFDHRGGARVLGYPISREFNFLGTRVQFFQRAVLQLQPSGGVTLLNILDEGLLSYNRINGSTFPALNPSVVQAAPSPADPNFAVKALDFVRANAPDEWEGLKTNFFSTFMNTVTYQEAFPNGGVDPGLMPLINLEIWGLPTSRPTYDANNGNFVYVRFQRGIMHFDKTSGLTQGILIGDHLKSLITGQNLPPDLEQDARSSRLYRQYTNNAIDGLARTSELFGTNLFAAFEKDGIVVPTPQPTATPLPAPTATPVPAGPPAAIAVAGSEWFVVQTNNALTLLSNNAPGHYASVRNYIYRIEETGGSSSLDIPNRTLKVIESNAFPPDWRGRGDEQLQWYAGLIVRHALYVERASRGQSTSGQEAEADALLRQKDAVRLLDTTGGQFTNYLTDAINGTVTIGPWDGPIAPQS